MRATGRKRIAVLALTLCTLAVPACSRETSEPRSAKTAQIRVSGSGTCLPLLRLLAKEYPRRAEVNFTYLSGLHSGAGIEGVSAGDLDIGAISRSLDKSESRLGLETTMLSDDALAIAVHATAPIDGLTSDQLRAIYRGDYKNWKELGGPDLPIVVLDRNEDESAKGIIRRYVLGDTVVTPDAIIMFYETDMVEALLTTKGAIGYFSLGYAVSQNVPVKLLKLDGVAPSVATVHDGTYKAVRPLGVVTGPDTSDAALRFVEWARGPEAARVMEAKGYAATTATVSQ